ncbi:MAG: DUF3592 domain-containing protein [Wenzhouxiangella sp.]|nr:MAG: DUF3592 domain-containing protein [Wenzhouxiangella sp.]
MKRIRHFFNALQTNWSEDPAARGAAKMTAGAVLVAEGVFGLGRRAMRGRRGRSGKRGKGGLIGGVIGLVVGGAVMIVGFGMAPSPYPDERSAQGEIVSVETTRNSEGETRFRAVYGFEVDGRTYRFPSRMTTNIRPTQGDTVAVAYSASNPEQARRTDGWGQRLHWLFIGGGLLVLLSSLFSLAISIALIVLGIMLFRSGRTDRQSAGESGGFISDLMSLASRASSGEIDVEQTAAGQAGASQGSV